MAGGKGEDGKGTAGKAGVGFDYQVLRWPNNPYIGQ